MMHHEVKTPEQALLYLADCHLATVSHFAMLKSKSKSEYERHIKIAQTSIDWIRDFNIEIKPHSRIYQVTSLPSKSVAEWANKYES